MTMSPETRERYDKMRAEVLRLAGELDPGQDYEGTRAMFQAVRDLDRTIGEFFHERPVLSEDMKALDEAAAEALCHRPPACWIDLRNTDFGRFEARVTYLTKVSYGASISPLVALANALKIIGLYDRANG